MDFNEFPLPEAIQHKLEALDFKAATPIQEQAIPVALSGKDLLGSAQTGTGKTAAFGLPSLSLTNIENTKTQTLVLCPTRELCIQISKDLKTRSLSSCKSLK